MRLEDRIAVSTGAGQGTGPAAAERDAELACVQALCIDAGPAVAA